MVGVQQQFGRTSGMDRRWIGNLSVLRREVNGTNGNRRSDLDSADRTSPARHFQVGGVCQLSRHQFSPEDVRAVGRPLIQEGLPTLCPVL